MSKPREVMTEKEEMRQVTRELHEAAAAARDAARDLRAVKHLIESTAADTVARLVDEQGRIAADRLAELARECQQVVLEQETITRDHYGRLLGAENHIGLITTIADMVYAAMLPELNRVLATLPGATGKTKIRPTVVAPPPDTAPRPLPTVGVIAKDEYARRLANGTLPPVDLIIDGTVEIAPGAGVWQILTDAVTADQ
jgi:hypothetical protein